MIRTIELLPQLSITIVIGRPQGRGRGATVRATPVERSQPFPIVHEFVSDKPQPKLQATWQLVDGKPVFAWSIVPQPDGELIQE